MKCKNCNNDIISIFKVGDLVSHIASGDKMVIMKVIGTNDYTGGLSLPAYECRYRAEVDSYFKKETFSEFELIKK